MSYIRWCLEKLGLARAVGRHIPADAESLRTEFKTRYHNFKLLLGANNKVLQIMSELEEALRSGRPFGMSFIKANCTAVSVGVFRMIQCLEQLAPGKYGDLTERFRTIRDSITGILSVKRESGGGPMTIPLDEVDKSRADEAGNKMANLGEIRNRLGLRVPNGFVISSHAFRTFIKFGDLQSEIDRLLQSSPAQEMDELFSLSAEIQQLIIRSPVPEELERAIRNAYSGLEENDGHGVRISMRSSALGEDSSGTSFAGQYRSELNVSSENLIEAYKEIVASKYSLQAISYRLNKGIPDEDIDMCVGCLTMIKAVAGGVIYSRNPLNIRDHRILVHSALGLPKSVVDGGMGADLFALSRENPLRVSERHISEKKEKFICYSDEGVCRLEITGQEGSAASISDEKALDLGRIALQIEEYYDSPQDIEWALDERGNLFILQCRPLGQNEEFMDAGRELTEEIPPGEVIVSGGIAASSGSACGDVFVVRKESDTLLFPKGGILVVKQALPRWAALLGRVAGLVAEQGTAAGHLANVAREFGVPALFGIEGACDLLENAETVTVDADGRRIYKGKIDTGVHCSLARKSLMEGSPVLEVLKKVSEHVVPLHLLDPESSEFIPARCSTFHDITRFCHEKSVREMFSFGKDHHFSERASKQLVCEIPMRWWILNLDDGFREDIPGKFVNLDNICSIPMRAVWDGITAVQWGGPPPVDSRGFMSILMEASSNPGLDPSMPSPYADRNYFMISRNFCSLNSTFGFHFTTIEALVGERVNENYISFGLKGGAADHARRALRARFVGEILEEFEFRAEVRGDGVIARIEGYDEETMKEKLRILGYLLIHTRQLDMVMSNETSYLQQKSRLLGDILSVVTGPRTVGAATLQN
jgi:pyruvate,water dikinase